MDRVYLSGAVQSKPDISTLTSKGYPTDGNPATGLGPTTPGAAWAYMIMEELMAVVEAAGTSPDASTLTQIRDAIPKYVPSRLAEKSIDGKTIKDRTLSGLKLATSAVEFAHFAASVLASEDEARAGVAKDKILTPHLMKIALESLMKSAVPTGTILPFMGQVAPEGYLVCNGAAMPRDKYAALFKVLGTRCGAGDGSTTFNLPNFDGRVLQGTSNPEDVGKLLEASLPNITGSIQRNNTQGLVTESSYPQGSLTRVASSNLTEGLTSAPGKTHRLGFDASKSNNLYSGSSFQPSAGLTLLCIKA